MFFRIVTICLVLAAGYASYQIWAVRNYYNFIRLPDAAFTIHKAQGNQTSLTIVEFLDYGCLPCRTSHRVLMEYAQKNPDITVVIRPVPYAPDMAKVAAESALAAGLQGKFWEMDKALTEYMGAYDDKFYRETAAVYDLDYERMVNDAKGDKVFELAKNNVAASVRAGVTSAPALMVGDTVYELKQPLTVPDLIRMVQAEKTH